MTALLSERLGDYALLEELGCSARGHLYRARPITREAEDKVGGRQRVVIRVLRPTCRDMAWLHRLTSRFRQLQAIDHPGVIGYLECFSVRESRGNDLYCIVMEHLEGETLAERIERHPQGLPWQQVRQIYRDVIGLLIHVRNHGIIHGDIRPSNIFIKRAGGCCLIDFCPVRPAEGLSRASVGTPVIHDFLAPEFSWDPEAPADEAADIFTLGTGLYQALTGKLPFEPLQGGDEHHLWIKRWQDPLAGDPPTFDRVFRVLVGAKALVAQSLKVERASRFNQFEEMLHALDKVDARVIRHEYTGIRIELQSWIGTGSLGDVLQGRLTGNEGHAKTVVVKQIPETPEGSCLRRDARLLSRQPQQHLIRCLDLIDASGAGGENQQYMALEYLPDLQDCTLRARLRAGRCLSASEAITLFNNYLQALSFLHGFDPPIVHRNIKPENLYAPPGKPESALIMEPGIARGVREVRVSGWTPETLNYMPPEVAREGSERAEPAADIYSLGLCLFEALTGRPMFEPLPDDPTEAWMSFRQRALERVEVDMEDAVFQEYPDFKTIIIRATSRNARERFFHAKEMISALSVMGTIPDDGPADTARPPRATAPFNLHRPRLTPDPQTAPPPAPKKDLSGSPANSPAVPEQAENGHPFTPGPVVKSPPRSYGHRAPVLLLLLIVLTGVFAYFHSPTFNAWVQKAMNELGIGDFAAVSDETVPSTPQRRHVKRVAPAEAASLSEAIGPLPEVRPTLSAAEEIAVADGRAELWLGLNSPGAADVALYEQLQQRGRKLPEAFLRSFGEALNRGSIERAEAIITDWTQLTPYLPVMDITDEQHQDMAGDMGRRLGLLHLGSMTDEVMRRVPDRLDTPTELYLTEQLLSELDRSISQKWDGLEAEDVEEAVEALREQIRLRMVDFIQRLVQRGEEAAAEGRTDFDGRALLRSLQNNYPSLVRMVVGEYVTASMRLEQLRESRQRFITRKGLIEQLLDAPLATETAPEKLDSAAMTLRLIEDTGSAGMNADDWNREVKAIRQSLTDRVKELIDYRRELVLSSLDYTEPLEEQLQPLSLVAWEAPAAIALVEDYHQSMLESVELMKSLQSDWAEIVLETGTVESEDFPAVWRRIDDLARRLKTWEERGRPPVHDFEQRDVTGKLRTAMRATLLAQVEETAREAVRRYVTGTGGDVLRNQLMKLESEFTAALALVRDEYTEALAAVDSAREERRHGDDFHLPLESRSTGP